MSNQVNPPAQGDAGPLELAEQQLEGIAGGGVIAPERVVKLRNLLSQVTGPQRPPRRQPR